MLKNSFFQVAFESAMFYIEQISKVIYISTQDPLYIKNGKTFSFMQNSKHPNAKKTPSA